MKKQLLLFVMMLLPMVAIADAVEIDGIYYNLITKAKAAEVTSSPNKYQGSIVIPETVNYNNVTYSVTSIGYQAFQYCSGLTSITIPNSVTSIEEGAFCNCSGLTSVTIGNSVTSIGYQAFQGCFGLTSITIPNSVTSIGNYVFSGCSGLTSVTIGNSVTSIGDFAFYGCSSLQKVIVSDIAAWCGISFGSGYSNPLYYAHHIYSDENTEIKDLVIPNSVTSIGIEAFNGCSGLTSVTIPNSVTSIRNSAFFGCSGLTSVTIPNSVTSIGGDAFSGCSGLTSITIPNSVTSIGSGAFYGCSGLTSVTIPNSVTSIGWATFSSCSALTSVTIGSGIQLIYSQAFAKCSELTDVYCLAENVPSTNNDAFSESYIDYATLHVPDASVENYKATAPWSGFKEVVGLSGTTPPTPEKCEKPTISYQNGKLTFTCATEGAECVTYISDADIKTHYGNEISLTATYNISVYATKAGCENSDVAIATLCWIDVTPQTEGLMNGVAQIPSNVVLVKTDNGFITVDGVDDGIQVSAYTADGVLAGSAISRNGGALLNTNIRPGNAAIVKIGEKSIKVVMK